MQLILHYLQLRKGFPGIAEGRRFRVTLDAVSDILFCSTRNAKLAIIKMQEAGWIEFVSGRGRGNHSVLTFLVPAEPLLLEVAKTYVDRGDLQAATDLMKEFGNHLAKEQFREWFQQTLGFQVERSEGALVETLRFPVFRPINTLDPANAFYAFDAHMVTQIFDTLVTYNTATDRIEGKIAHYWESSTDATEWVFYLRKGVLFHHGRECVAEDVRRSLLRLRDGGHPQSWLVKCVKEIKVVDPYLIRIHLHHPNHLFLRNLCFPPTSIVPVDVAERHADAFALQPIGSGPFKVTQHTESVCTLEAFPSYFFGRPALDRIEIMKLSKDTMDYIRPSENDQIIVNTGDAERFSDTTWEDMGAEYEGSSILTFNMNKEGPQQFLEFRKAVSLLIDRSAMVQELGYPRVMPSQGLHRGAPPGFVQGQSDVAEATQLLSAIAYAGQAIELAVYERHQVDADWIRECCSAAGIPVKVTVIPWDQMLQKETIQTADAILFEAVLSEGQVSELELYEYDNSFVKLHLPGETIAYLRKQLAEIVAEPSEAKRAMMLQSIEREPQESYLLLFLVHKKLVTAFPASTRGVGVNSRGWVDFCHVWYQRHLCDEYQP